MIYTLIVLYNKKITDSLTFDYLKKNTKDINIIIFDNSNEDYRSFNEDYCSNNNIDYYTLHSNVGISKAYNYVIKKIDLSDEKYLIILDDDTILNDSYIEEITKLVNESKYDVILPKIFANKIYISPCRVQFGCRIRSIGDFNNIDYSSISAINSGMAVRTSVFKTILYNENLFLDYVDHDFMRQIRNNNYKIMVLDSVINQNYSRFEKKNIESELTRFRIYIKDFKKYCSNCHNLLFYYISTIRYRIQLSLKYKNMIFLISK